MEEKQILRLLLQRSEGAIDALAAAFGKGMLRLAMNILGDRADAEECVNDTWLALWNAIPPAQPDPLSAYAYRTGRNIALKRQRHNAAQKRSRYDLSLEELAEVIGGDALWERIEAKALGQAIDQWLSTLSRENRVIFLRRYWFGDSLQSLAAREGLTENTLNVRLHRLRSKLRDYLIKEELI